MFIYMITKYITISNVKIMNFCSSTFHNFREVKKKELPSPILKCLRITDRINPMERKWSLDICEATYCFTNI